MSGISQVLDEERLRLDLDPQVVSLLEAIADELDDKYAMTPEKAAALRAPFPPGSIGQLPKPYKRDSPKGTCSECGGYHGLPAVHLDYVGHAATTDRLLSVDPRWTWEPMAYTPEGLPLIRDGQLWIRLTVCGVTRPGVGDGSSDKERIGDAIRNAAMRFGVALDLWAKEDLSAVHDPEARPVAEAKRDLLAILVDGGMDAQTAKDTARELWALHPPAGQTVTGAEWQTLADTARSIVPSDGAEAPGPDGREESEPSASIGQGEGGGPGAAVGDGPSPEPNPLDPGVQELGIAWGRALAWIKGSGSTTKKNNVRHAVNLFVTGDPERWHTADLTSDERARVLGMVEDLHGPAVLDPASLDTPVIVWREGDSSTAMPVPTEQPSLLGDGSAS